MRRKEPNRNKWCLECREVTAHRNTKCYSKKHPILISEARFDQFCMLCSCELLIDIDFDKCPECNQVFKRDV